MNLDIPPELSATAGVIWAWAVDFLPRLLGAAVLLVGGVIAARYVARGITSLADRTGRVDPTLKPVLRTVIRYGISIVVIVAALGQLGVQTASILAVLGAAGLAIGLALQGTLANIAAGLMLLWLRPFRGGDYIETKDVTGTVEEVGLFNTRLRTWDGLYKFAPNSTLWNTIITNYTRNPTRLALVEFQIGYQSDLGSARQILTDVANAHPLVRKSPPVQVVPLSFTESGITLQVRAWTGTSDTFRAQWDITENGKAALEGAGHVLAFPQRFVHVTSETTTPPPAAVIAQRDPGSRAIAPAGDG